MPLQSWIRRCWQWLRTPLPRYTAARYVYLRVLAAISFTAFLSLFVQLPGLIGSNGVLPAEQFFTLASQHVTGVAAFLQFPSLAWIDASTATLQVFAVLGMIGAAALFFDVLPRIMLVVQWVLYLSLVVAGQTFLSFQWDILLLEALFFSVFLAPATRTPGEERGAPSRLGLGMLWFILFKLMFLSGVAKMGGGDPVWMDGTALSFHYLTQPLPTPVAWLMDKLPVWIHQVSVIIMFAVELLLPAVIWATDKLRLYAAAGIAALNVLIGVTGNYAFFNLLAVALCILLLADAYLAPVAEWVETHIGQFSLPSITAGRQSPVSTVLLLVLALVQAVVVTGMFTPGSLPGAMGEMEQTVARFRTVNTYGLFVDMTTTRPEILVQGSQDGDTWETYRFKYKPGAVEEMPPVVAPHQPRLDWQMWFAALQEAPPHWFNAFTIRLLQNREEVTALLAENPFPKEGPRFVRAVRYDYRFSNTTILTEQGEWWRRDRIDVYMEPVALEDLLQRQR